jgi:signal peptidase I
MDKTNPEPMSLKERVVDLVRTLAIALSVALVIRTLFIQPFHIPSQSMEPGLKIGDYIVVTKYSYGYSKYSLPLGAMLPDILPARIWADEPERGDVVVFRYPSDVKKDYIKRLVGMPGDTLEIQNGVLTINGQVAQQQSVVERGAYQGGLVRFFEETFPDGQAHRIRREGSIDPDPHLASNCIQISEPPYRCQAQKITVPQGHFFFMGDNRDNSQDSRFPDVGFVPFENLVGRAQVIVFSWRSLTRFFKSIR